MRSKPNYGEIVLLWLLFMLLYFLLLKLFTRDYLWLIKDHLILIETITIVELANPHCLFLSSTYPNLVLNWLNIAITLP